MYILKNPMNKLVGNLANEKMKKTNEHLGNDDVPWTQCNL
jgi:hypothetical protein